MSEPSAEQTIPKWTGTPTVAEMLADLTWEQLTSDGVITIEEVEAMLRAQGLDPTELDYLYE